MGDLGTTWTVVAALAAVALVVAAEVLRRRVRERRLSELDRFRVARRLAAADVAGLPVGSRRDEAERLLAGPTTSDDLAGVTALLADGTVPCFFDPRHGASVLDATWSPFVGTTWFVPACRADADRLAAGEPPRLRLVLRLGQRWVPWFAVGPALDGYARGYFGGRVDAPRREAGALAELLADGARERDIDVSVDAGVGWLGEAPINPHHRLGTAYVKGRRG
jgi:HAMP domain-containing protein